MPESHPVEQALEGLSHQHRQTEVGKWQVDALDRESPDVGLVVRVLLGPNVENIVAEIFHKKGLQVDSHTHQHRVGQEYPDGTQQEAKGVIGSPASRSRVEGDARFVLLAEGDLHVQHEQGAHAKVSREAKGRQEPPQLELVLGGLPDPNHLDGVYDLETRAGGHDEGGTEPVPGDDRQGLEHVGGCGIPAHLADVVVSRLCEGHDCVAWFFLFFRLFCIVSVSSYRRNELMSSPCVAIL
mmetsp:Transcript_19028/g.39081  ORF Transcript_19028/g.39081 Transcript_19028/m.39081 type:complete len:240 (-) Transcript_19028:80-799(-)